MAGHVRRGHSWFATTRICVMFFGVLTVIAASSVAQELGGAGTVQGTVKDPTGGVMAVGRRSI